MMPAQKTEQYRDELRSSRVEMLQHEDMNMTMHSTITIHEDGPRARLSEAWQWLDAQCNDAPDSADIWHVRHRHATDGAYLTDLLHTLQSGRYRLSPMQLCGEGENKKAMWGAQDALVLKWVALCIQPLLPLQPLHLSCEHVKGHGGGKQSVGKLHDLLTRTYTGETQHNDSPKKTSGYPWVCRTDIRGYYRHINKERLFAQVRQHVSDPVLRDLVHQYLHYTVEDGGTFHTPETGISRGCALSPLMGALHLYDMDAHFSAQKHIHYARYMDDVIILAKSRWSLRRHTKRLMQWFEEYGFEAHPDKTQIGRTEKGFDWMGAWLTDDGVRDIAPRAKANHREKVRRLYEQLARVPKWLRHRRQQQVHARVSTYRKRWHIWAGALLACMVGTAVAADRPLYVMSGNLPPGVSLLPGGRWSMSYNDSAGGLSISPSQLKGNVALGLTPGGTSTWTVPCGPGVLSVNGCMKVNGTGFFGFGWGGTTDAPSYPLVMVPMDGFLDFTLDNYGFHVKFDPSQPNGLDCGSITNSVSGGKLGDMFTCSGQDYLAIKWRNDAGVPQIFSGTATAIFYVTFDAYCNDCKPGVLDPKYAFAGAGLPRGMPPAPDRPSSIIVTGLTCNIDTSNPEPKIASTSINSSGGVGTYMGGASVNLTVACSGTNSAGSDVPIAVQIAATGQTRAEGDYQLVAEGQPSFYSTLTRGTGDCSSTGTNPNKMKVGLAYSNPVRTYAANEAGKSDTLNLVWALCSTGDTTQPPGQYTMTATASIVSF